MMLPLPCGLLPSEAAPRGRFTECGGIGPDAASCLVADGFCYRRGERLILSDHHSTFRGPGQSRFAVSTAEDIAARAAMISKRNTALRALQKGDRQDSGLSLQYLEYPPFAFIRHRRTKRWQKCTGLNEWQRPDLFALSDRVRRPAGDPEKKE